MSKFAYMDSLSDINVSTSEKAVVKRKASLYSHFMLSLDSLSTIKKKMNSVDIAFLLCDVIVLT